ncbi:MAG TPA: hypothetical protein VNY33_07910 [Gaiellaceae bacterium]|jgi:hypothetical protein|nr:hypothetical protein [Gaiellaceae bacterium]
MDTDFKPTFAAESAGPPTEPVVCTAETAECTCPDFCERDHEQD